jgi:hypothetical protein
MWQPKHPASEVVATLSFFFGAFISACSSVTALAVAAIGCLVVFALADRHGKAPPLLEDDTHRADLGRLVVEREVGIAQLAGLGIDDQVRLDAPAGECERRSCHRRRGWPARTASTGCSG